MNEQQNFVTSDISLAAFLLLKGIKLLSAERQKGKFEFTFSNINNDISPLCYEYIISDHPKYDAAMRQLKRKIYGQ